QERKDDDDDEEREADADHLVRGRLGPIVEILRRLIGGLSQLGGQLVERRALLRQHWTPHLGPEAGGLARRLAGARPQLHQEEVRRFVDLGADLLQSPYFVALRQESLQL